MITNTLYFIKVIDVYEEKDPVEAFRECNEKIKQWYNDGEIDLDSVIALGAFNHTTFIYRTAKGFYCNEI